MQSQVKHSATKGMVELVEPFYLMGKNEMTLTSQLVISQREIHEPL
jgi:hypothetical protein